MEEALVFIAVVSPAYMVMGMVSSNPNIVPLYTALALWALIKIVKYRGGQWWGFMEGVSIGVAINAHYSALFLLPLPVLVFVLHKEQRWKIIAMTALGLFITFIPLLLFNLNNHWVTVKNFWYYYRVGQYAYFVPNSWKIYVLQFWPRFLDSLFGTPLIITALLIMGTAGYIVHKLRRREISKVGIILLIFVIFNFFYMRYYRGERHEVYFYYLHPFVLIFTGFFLRFLLDISRVKLISYVFLICIGAFSLFTLIPMLFASGSSVGFQQRVSKMEQLYKNQKIAVYGCDSGGNNQAVFVSYLLEQDHMISSKGQKLGFPSSMCNLPSNSLFPPEPATISAYLKETVYPVNYKIDVFDFSVASESALKAAHWTQFTPRTVNDSKVRWWFNEKP